MTGKWGENLLFISFFAPFLEGSRILLQFITTSPFHFDFTFINNMKAAQIPQQKTSLQVVLEIVSPILSVLSFVFLRLVHWIQAYPYVIVIICLVALLTVCVCASRKEKWRWAQSIASFFGMLLLLSILSSCVSFRDNRKNTQIECLSDATEGLVETLGFQNIYETFDWLMDAVQNHKGVTMLVPIGWDVKGFCEEVFDTKKIAADYPDQESGQHRVLWYNVYRDEEKGGYKLQSEYTLAYVYGPYLKDSYRIDGIRVHDESVNYVLEGILHMQKEEWEEAKAAFEQADLLENVAGTYYLSDWYSVGYGVDPGAEGNKGKRKGEDLLAKAADGGCRAARVKLGTQIMEDPGHTLVQISKAEEYLRGAAVLTSVAVPGVITEAQKALVSLNSYYNTTGKHRKAYRMSKKCYTSYNDLHVKYNAHLSNCLKRKSGKYYKEALEIIGEGEPVGEGNCYVAHAVMYMYGLGVNEDPGKAENLLRYAVDSLDYFPAYKTLSELFRKENRDGASFFEDLYNVEFSKNVR